MPDLLDQLNEAQTQLTTDEPNYISSLRAKYYPVSISSRAFTSAEKEWLASNTSLKVGYLNDYLPYSDTNEEGNVNGIYQSNAVTSSITELRSDILKNRRYRNLSMHQSKTSDDRC